MKIVHVAASVAPQYGGPSAALPPTCVALADRGHDVHLVTTTRGFARGVTSLDPDAFAGLRVEYHPTVAPQRWGTAPALARSLRRHMGSTDVVHIHSLYLFHAAAAATIARVARVPYIIRPHGTLDGYHRARHATQKRLYDSALQARLIRGAAGIHAMSWAEADEINELHLGVPVFVVPHGVAVPAATANDDPRRSRSILFLGRIARKKRVDLVARAFIDLASTDAEVRLTLAGPDDDGSLGLVNALLHQYGLQGRVSLPGFVGLEAKERLLDGSAVFVLPSDAENFGIAVLEALAHRLPVVLSRHVALAGKVDAVGAGLIVEQTPRAVADAIATIMGNPTLAHEMGKRGRQLVENEFGWPRVAEALEARYLAVAR